jgi:serine/threonine-protein kinase
MAVGELVGATLGHHAVLEKIGEGGMGVVYKARDLRLGRLVALKVLAPGTLADDEQRRRRFKQEACAASALNHPNIVTVYEIDREGALDFIAMEYIPGGTLRELIARGPLPVRQAVGLAVQVADALAAAHAAGVVHRDLKPSNIMVSPEGRVKVVDFGLARSGEPLLPSVETATALTAAGTVVGTVAYMSPEQATGRPVDARSDIFSAGCVLYEIVSGRRAFDGDSSVDVLAAVLRDTPPSVTDAPAVKHVIDRCLTKDPAGRYQSASDLRAALESCLAGTAVATAASIAVLPFVSLGGGSGEDYLSEGLAEAIIDALTHLEGLRVVARTSAFAVASQGRDVRDIGARLGVSSVLEGSVRRAGARVRVTVQLVTTGDGTHVWSERYDRELGDVFALEDDIATAVAARLRGEQPAGSHRPPRARVGAEAHQAYLEGRYHLARGGPEGLGRARACFERAIGRDPEFALAYDSLAEVYWFFGFFGAILPRDAFAQSTWYALRALELDDSLADTHALLGMLRKEMDYNWPEVRREMARAAALNPASPVVHVRNAISGLMPLGLLDEATSEVLRALEADPLSISVRWWLACVHWLARRPEQAVAVGRGMVELDSTSFFGHWALGLALVDAGAADEAADEMQLAHTLSGGGLVPLGFLGYLHGAAGRQAEARGILEHLAQAARAGYVPPSSFASVHVGLGDIDAAFEWLDRAIDARDPLIMPIKSFPYLDPLRGDPRFTALLRKMNLA